MFSRGFYTLFHVRGAPVRVHWSAPLGLVVFGGWSPGGWVGVFLLIVLHELGHAALAWRFGYQVTAMRVHAFGGDCQMSGDMTRAEDAAIAWGGVLAQAAVWVVASVTIWVAGVPEGAFFAALAYAFTTRNAWMIAFNLMPIPPLDGYAAWRLPVMWWQGRRELRSYLKDRAARQRQVSRERRAEREAAMEEALAELEKVDQEPPEMPPEVRAVLGKVVDQVSREELEKRKRDKPG
jgi:stage IV sporulation protein FB